MRAALVVHDGNRILAANPSAGAALGCRRTQLLGTPPFEAMHPDFVGLGLRSALEGVTRPYEIVFRRRSGRDIKGLVSGRQAKYKGNTVRLVRFIWDH